MNDYYYNSDNSANTNISNDQILNLLAKQQTQIDRILQILSEHDSIIRDFRN